MAFVEMYTFRLLVLSSINALAGSFYLCSSAKLAKIVRHSRSSSSSLSSSSSSSTLILNSLAKAVAPSMAVGKDKHRVEVLYLLLIPLLEILEQVLQFH